MTFDTILKVICASAGGLVGALFGPMDALFFTLVGFTVADFLTGIVKAVIMKDLRSGKAFAGGLKKILIYVVVALGVGLDRMVPDANGVFRSLVIGYYIATEGLSILENVGMCGVPFPAKLRAVLAQLKDKSEGENDEAH